MNFNVGEGNAVHNNTNFKISFNSYSKSVLINILFIQIYKISRYISDVQILNNNN